MCSGGRCSGGNLGDCLAHGTARLAPGATCHARYAGYARDCAPKAQKVAPESKGRSTCEKGGCTRWSEQLGTGERTYFYSRYTGFKIGGRSL